VRVSSEGLYKINSLDLYVDDPEDEKNQVEIDLFEYDKVVEKKNTAFTGYKDTLIISLVNKIK